MRNNVKSKYDDKLTIEMSIYSILTLLNKRDEIVPKKMIAKSTRLFIQSSIDHYHRSYRSKYNN